MHTDELLKASDENKKFRVPIVRSAFAERFLTHNPPIMEFLPTQWRYHGDDLHGW